ncbi:DUF3347 domain-containing protein [Algoriphagus sp. CAU 1675]|uniref:DUF3347 domain-containing protein n=1 Tax=Algoriphagus sp. CAU 1675 TaxID=3032597 RepID=UPI0023DB88A7|nr:DUF3347 domain-containing protein [Algoriphagus sp. CAU 1675]MDF2157643.1 DUF3347 domain-containing protein [Algoriphagus sp. CAU 1675]
MKKSTILAFAISLAFYSCSGEKSTESHEDHQAQEESAMQSVSVPESKGTSEIINSYLEVKNALVEDNESLASEKSQALVTSLEQFDIATVAGNEIEELERLQLDAIDLAKNIQGSQIADQRESFQALSMLMKDLLKIAGTDRTLYHQYCPMYKNNTGGMWLSAEKEIKNPLFGSSMLTCGVVEDSLISTVD